MHTCTGAHTHTMHTNRQHVIIVCASLMTVVNNNYMHVHRIYLISTNQIIVSQYHGVCGL